MATEIQDIDDTTGNVRIKHDASWCTSSTF